MKDRNVSAALPFEDTLWAAADELRGEIEESDYKHIVLGLIFLRFVSESFEHRRTEIATEVADATSALFLPDPDQRRLALEDGDYYSMKRVPWLPPAARWSDLLANAKQPDIGQRIDAAMDAIETANVSLRGVLPKNYGRAELRARTLGRLIELFSDIETRIAGSSEDVLGRVYEYFLNRFGTNEGGQYYTPQSVVRLLVEMLEPYQGRVFDPACGSGGMFVQSVKFAEAHGSRRGDISIIGQELTPTTWRLAKMNLAIRFIEADLGDGPGDSFLEDKHRDKRAEFVLANPPFNDIWPADQLRADPRWVYGVPSAGNANFAWAQHFLYHLAPGGRTGFVLANGALSDRDGGQGQIRERMVEADLFEAIVSLPDKLFQTTTRGTAVPVSLLFMAKERRTRAGEILFIDARRLGRLVSRRQRVLTDEDLTSIADVFHRWRTGEGEPYGDIPGFVRSVALDEVRQHAYILNPPRYTGSPDAALDALDTSVADLTEGVAAISSTVGSWSDATSVLVEMEATLADQGSWREVSLGQVASLSKAKVNPGREPATTFAHYSIPAFDLFRQPALELGSAIKSDKWKVPAGAVLVSKLNPQTPRVWLPDPAVAAAAICSTEFLVLQPRVGISSELLYVLVSSTLFQRRLATLIRGTTGSRQRVSTDDALGIVVRVPPPDIADALSAAASQLIDAERLMRRALIAWEGLVPRLVGTGDGFDQRVSMHDIERDSVE